MEDTSREIKIEKYETGWVIEIKNKQWISTGHYVTPCFILYSDSKTFERLIELHNDYLIDHSTIDKKVYEGRDLKDLLPSLLEHGEILRYEEPVNILPFDKSEYLGNKVLEQKSLHYREQFEKYGKDLRFENNHQKIDKE